MVERSFPCTIRSIDGEVVYLLSRYAWHVVNLGVITRDGHTLAAANEVVVNENAVVTVANGAVLAVRLQVSLRRSESFITPVDLYSVCIFPTSDLSSDYEPRSLSATAVALIQCHCIGVRKCSARDDDSFWAVCTIALVEHMARRTTKTQTFRRFRQSVQEVASPIVVEKLKEMEIHKAAGKGAIEWMEAMHTNYHFWTEMIRAVRAYLGLFLRARMEEMEYLSEIDQIDPNSEVGFTVMAKAFNLQITLFSPTPDFKRNYCTEEPSSEITVIYLFRDLNVFHILYSKAQLDMENYSLEDRMVVSRRIGVMDATELYHKQKEKVRIGSSVVEEVSAKVRGLGQIVRFAQAADRLLQAVDSAVTGEKVAGLRTTELHKVSLLVSQEQTQALEQIAELRKSSGSYLPSFALTKLEKITQSSSQFSPRPSQCDHCQKEPGSVILDCTHTFCQKDIDYFIEKSFKKNPLLLKPNGETMDDFQCPLTSCSMRISGFKLREILGDTPFNSALTRVIEQTRSKCCPLCRKTRSFDHFKLRCSCSLPPCVYCCCDIMRRQVGVCVCDVQFAQADLELLAQEKAQCSVCEQWKLLYSDFSNIECEDHILCQDCLVLSLQQRRCRHCFRPFTREEIGTLQPFEKYCQYCHVECTGRRLNTQCACVICLPCAQQGVVQNQHCGQCFSCGKPLSVLGSNQLFALLNATQRICPLCSQAIIQTTEIFLPCGDVCHIDCMNAYIAQEIAVPDRKISCPKCRNVVSMAAVCSYFPPNIQEFFFQIETQLKSVKCPRCDRLTPDRGDDGVLKRAVLCKHCRHYFCLKCLQLYRQDHNPQQCRFLQIQEAVKVAEKLAGAEAVVQCPGCKTPFLCSDSCTEGKCLTRGCGMMFCVQCATPACQYITHGDAWHRPSCPRYSPSALSLSRSSLCKYCEQSKSLCRPPFNLKTPRRFDFDEY